MKQNAWKISLSKVTVILIVASVLISPSSLFEISAQRGKKVQSNRKIYNRFAHDNAAHRKQSCSSCHKAPTGFSNAETAAGASYRYPDITDYPDHDSCFDCHRQQLFRGARPAICSICHTKVSPRDKARFAFPVPNQPEEFGVRFPHNAHQDIIAKVAIPQTKPNEKTDYNNCTICHLPAKDKIYNTAPRRPQMVALETGLVVAAHREKIQAPVGYFKTRPNGHDSCFNCHYSEQKPTRNDCAGCHIPLGNPLAESNVLERLSLNFNHDSKKEKIDLDEKTGKENKIFVYNHAQECTSCHLRITQSADLRMLDPDVPFFTCAKCHVDEIKSEVNRRNEDLVKRKANAQHQIQSCSFCHNTFVGSYQLPESHKVIKP
jgi:hypothetical protein